MAGTKISALPAATAVTDGDLVPIVTGGINKTATPAVLVDDRVDAALVVARQAELHDTYTDKADGPITTADSGQPWNFYHEPTLGGAFEVVSGKLATDGVVAGVTAAYMDADLGAKVARIGARWTFGSSGSTDTGVMVLLAWAQPFANGPVPDSSCHLRISPTTVNYDVWDGNVMTTVGFYIFPTPLATDGTTVHEAECFIDGDTATVRLPDGKIMTFTHALIEAQDTPHAGWEEFCTNQSTDHRVEIIETWADPVPSKTYNASPLGSIYQFIRGRETLFPAPLDPVVVDYMPSPAANVAVTTSETSIDATNLQITVIAPASGKVLLEFMGFLSMTGSTRVFWKVLGGVGSGQREVVGQQFTGNVAYRHLMTGMTPDQSYTLTWRHFAVAASTATFMLDGPNTRGATMKATPIR